MSLAKKLLLFTILSVCAFALADDLPFGSGTLRNLAAEADVVAVVREPQRLASDTTATEDPTRAKYVLYTVQVQEVLKGAGKVGEQLRVAFPQSFDVRRMEELNNAVLFLRRVPQDALQKTNIPAGQVTYLVVSGRYGTLAANVPDRKEAIGSYLNVLRADAVALDKLDWTARYVNSPDPFLQRSAVMELYFERQRPRALEQLSAAVRSEAVLPSVKETAIKALQASGSVMAVTTLSEVAEDANAQRRVREAAVQAVQTLPGGAARVRQWTTVGDSVLAPAARAVLEKANK